MEISYKYIDSNLQNWQALKELADQTIDEQMLPLSQTKMLNNTLAVAAFDGGRLVGYGARTAYYPATKTAEVGSLIVSPEYRRRKIGSGIMRRVTARVIQVSAYNESVRGIIAFCNPSSAKLFEKQGFQHITLDKAPPDSLLSCAKCPKKCLVSLNSCCDRAYIYEDPWE